MSDISNETTNKKQRLGRGLGSLLGGASETLTTPQANALPASKLNTQSATLNTHDNQSMTQEGKVWQVPVDKISPSEFQPRIHFEKERLEELAASIRQNGILQPIVARKIANGKFEIIAGERRWRAAQLAGLHEVPLILKNLENQAALEMAIIENIQREDLNPIEEAEAYQRLAQEFKLTQQQVADKVGKDRATVANAMRLLALPASVREMLVQGRITSGHAKVLLSLTQSNQQFELAKKVEQQKLSVRQLEKIVALEIQKTDKTLNNNKMESSVPQRLISGLAEDLQKALGTKVTIEYLNSKGKISIQFYSDDELTQIVERLKDSHGRH